MKPLQIMIDEGLLARLDADEEVQREGRSAILQRAAVQYLDQKRRRLIAQAYRDAYGDSGEMDEEFAGWQEEGVEAER